MVQKQSVRAVVLILYLGIFFLMNYLAVGKWLPETSYKGLWFFTGIASILLGNLLVTPFFTKPVDAISYVVLALVAIFLVNDWKNWDLGDRIIYITSITILLLVLVASFIAILFKDSTKTPYRKVSKSCFIISELLGNQKVIFSVVILFALIVFHRSNSREIFFIMLAWMISVVIQPDKNIFYLANRIGSIWKTRLSPNMIGRINSYQSPGIILIHQPETAYTSFGTRIVYKNSHNEIKTGITLNYVGQDEQLLLRAIDYDLKDKLDHGLTEYTTLLNPNAVVTLDSLMTNQVTHNEDGILHELDNLIGIVDEQTTIEKLRFEVIKNSDIEEGCLVEVEIGGTKVLYQVLDGITLEDIVYQKNKYGYVRGYATKIGIWDNTHHKFKPSKWLPQINSPVFLRKSVTFKPTINTIGHFPMTDYHVDIQNINDLVTHNTAILGILGIGKSMLSIELVERMIKNKIKVICIDLTDQYSRELSIFYDATWHEESNRTIQEAGKIRSDEFEENPEEGGSIKNLYSCMEQDLNSYLNKDTEHYLKIYNPAQFSATKQLADPKSYMANGIWKRSASLWDVTPVEITSIITETTLRLLQDRTSSEARACLVFEEAHSLIPEWNSAVSDGDKSATNRTARSILQGRKYGLGCILITQRTANVTKTILNQCNSIFAMRTFDDTGKNFISNYIGSDYADRLSSLQERQAVFYGKASSSENPVLIRLNDREDFIQVFRKGDQSH